MFAKKPKVFGSRTTRETITPAIRTPPVTTNLMWLSGAITFLRNLVPRSIDGKTLTKSAPAWLAVTISLGVIAPDQFIPLLESDPLFPELGEWIIREAIYSAKKILKKCPEFVININLSYTQLQKPDFVDMVLRILNELGYPPEHLCFEVTERCRFLDIKLLKNVTTSLKSRGVLIALDDFGTGFSSVGIVKELPLDIIKIDKAFVSQIEQSYQDRELIKYFADLANLFGAKVCVEGIETSQMRDILQHYNVESFQGYYYAKPLPFDTIYEWSRKSETAPKTE